MRRALVTVINDDTIVYHRECISLSNNIYLDDLHKDKIVFYKDQIYIDRYDQDTSIKVALGKDTSMTITQGSQSLEIPIILERLEIEREYIKALYDAGVKIEIHIDLMQEII